MEQCLRMQQCLHMDHCSCQVLCLEQAVAVQHQSPLREPDIPLAQQRPVPLVGSGESEPEISGQQYLLLKLQLLLLTQGDFCVGQEVIEARRVDLVVLGSQEQASHQNALSVPLALQHPRLDRSGTLLPLAPAFLLLSPAFLLLPPALVPDHTEVVEHADSDVDGLGLELERLEAGGDELDEEIVPEAGLLGSEAAGRFEVSVLELALVVVGGWSVGGEKGRGEGVLGSELGVVGGVEVHVC